jgi:hypothetical protein
MSSIKKYIMILFLGFLAIIFYLFLIFPAAIFCKIFNVKLLDEAITYKSESYWLKRPEK